MTDQNNQHAGNGLVTVEAALAYGGKLYDTAQDYDTALDHVAQLLDDAVMLFERGSYGSATFLAITALEETSKAHVGSFRRERDGPLAKGRDPLRDHKAKHSMALLPTVFMTERIITALGQQRADALHAEAQATGFTAMREAALYCARSPTGFVSPKIAVPPLCAWEFIVLAIEAADDALVGVTNHSFDIGKTFDALFERISARRPT